jgi:hypothetical protein
MGNDGGGGGDGTHNSSKPLLEAVSERTTKTHSEQFCAFLSASAPVRLPAACLPACPPARSLARSLACSLVVVVVVDVRSVC